VRAVYIVMEPLGWSVLVPLSLACLLTGLVLSLGTPWGFVRHHWVLITLLINVLAARSSVAGRGGNQCPGD
jgi:hypothetical protein